MLNSNVLVTTMRLNGHNQMEITLRGTEENMDNYSINEKIIELGIRAYKYIRGSKEINKRTGEVSMSYIEEVDELWLDESPNQVITINEPSVLEKQVGDISSICLICGRVKCTTECVCEME